MDMYAEIGSKSNTMMFSERPADINALLAQVGTVMSATNNSSNSGGKGTTMKVDDAAAMDQGSKDIAAKLLGAHSSPDSKK